MNSASDTPSRLSARPGNALSRRTHLIDPSTHFAPDVHRYVLPERIDELGRGASGLSHPEQAIRQQNTSAKVGGQSERTEQLSGKEAGDPAL